MFEHKKFPNTLLQTLATLTLVVLFLSDMVTIIVQIKLFVVTFAFVNCRKDIKFSAHIVMAFSLIVALGQEVNITPLSRDLIIYSLVLFTISHHFKRRKVQFKSPKRTVLLKESNETT